MKQECNVYVPHSNGQLFQVPQVPGLNVHAQTFAPAAYQPMVPVMSPPMMATPMPQFSQNNVPLAGPFAANPRPVENWAPQVPVMQHAPIPNQQLLN